MPNARQILEHLAQEEAVLTDSHFVYTSGLHGTAYINMRRVAHQSEWLADLGYDLAEHEILDDAEIDLVIGPETLGRTLAGYVADMLSVDGIWCDVLTKKDGEGEVKYASFSEKLDFGRLVSGRRVAIVDDLLTTGSSIKLVAKLVADHGGTPVAALAVVRRTPDITAEQCGVEKLGVLVGVPNFVTFTEAECQSHGPCSQRVPVVLRPGHGHEWIKSHPDYPTA